METINQNTGNTTTEKSSGDRSRKGRIFAGLLVVAVGVAFLMRETGFDFPRWLFSFESMLIILGLYLGFRHSFKGVMWLIPLGIGVLLMVDDIYPYYDLSDYLWPIAIIVVGLFIMFRQGRKRSDADWNSWDKGNAQNFSDDHIDSAVVFGGVKKNIVSKNFRGGEAVTVFGGTDINLMQADIEGRVVLELTQAFGGTKLIVPPNWKIQTEEMVAIFGGVEDKRPQLADTSAINHNKVLVLKGTCIFGGIDIKSY